MSDVKVAEQEARNGDSSGAPSMVPCGQVTDEQRTSLSGWAEDVSSAAGNVLATLAGRSVTCALTGAPVALTVTAGQWLQGKLLISSPSGNPGEAAILFSERQGLALVDLASGGDGTPGDASLDDDGRSLLEEVLSQVTGVVARDGNQLGVAATWSGLQSIAPVALVELMSEGGWATAEIDIAIDDQPVGKLYTALSGQALAAVAATQPAASEAASGGDEGRVSVQSARFGPLDAAPGDGPRRSLEIIVDVPLQLTVELGRTTRRIKDVLALTPGSVVELDRLAGESVDVLVNGKLVAKGEVVVIDENFGVRITDIVTPRERISHIG